uniref:AIG1-type G domain-containing protein n=1 Tax=Anas platyrhynchos TaxID=8839 RepID=A0A8B9T5Z7_ANAPL
MSTVLQADTGRHCCHFLVAVSVPRGQGERQRRTCRKVRAGGQGPRGSVPAGRAPRGTGNLSPGSGAGKWLFPLSPSVSFPSSQSSLPMLASSHQQQPEPSPLLVKIPSAVSDAHSIRVPADGALGVCFCLRSVTVAVCRVYLQPGVGGGLEMRLIVAGKAGGGKSATGNTLLGQRVFESKLSHEPVTVSCARAQGHWDGEDFTVSAVRCAKEIIRCIRLSSPGPHALLLVTQLGRFTKEDEEAAERLQDIFGADVLQHTIVIFTRAEELVRGSLQDYVKYSNNRALRKLIERCGNRYCWLQQPGSWSRTGPPGHGADGDDPLHGAGEWGQVLQQ